MSPTTLRQLARRQETLRKRLSRVEEDADRLVMDLLTLADEIDGQPVASERGPGPPRLRSARDAQDALRRTAEAGVSRLVIERRSDESADVQIDDGKRFTLSPALADLLAILASSRGQASGDGLPGWKSLEEIARLLEKRSGRPLSTHAVTQQIHRLRRELFERGAVNPWLVQTHRRAGARFALRSPAGTRDGD